MTRKIVLVLCALAFVPLFGFAEPTADELEQNRRKLEQLKKQPELLQRLRLSAQSFLALPTDRRDKVVKLDQDLAKEKRLRAVLERYVDWLEQLEEKDRQRISDAPDNKTRLALIRDLKDQEWLRSQPKAIREQHTALLPEKRAEFVKNLRQEEKQRRQEWRIAARFWDKLENKTPLEARLADLPKEVQSYFNEYLSRFLSKEEKDRLALAEGKWPQYMITLVELADKHPPALPSLTDDGPRKFDELPAEVRKELGRRLPKGPKKLESFTGPWKKFAPRIVDFAMKNSHVLPNEFLAYSPKCLSKDMKEFIDKKLTPVLDNDEKLEFATKTSNGSWPDYPQTIEKLARNHNLTVPWQTLPGPRERWDNYRLK